MSILRGSKSHSLGNNSIPLLKRPLLWLNLVCLDAPLVALSWYLLFSCCFHTGLRSAEGAALFLTAWGFYLVVRLVDWMSLPAGAERSVRAAFCQRHRRLWFALLPLIGVLDGAIVFGGLPRPLIWQGICLGTVASLYLVTNFLFSRVWRVLPLKELAIGFLFATGTVLALVPRPPLSTPFLLAAFLFACVCSLNCMNIAVWERGLDEKHSKHSFATERARPALYVRVMSVAVCLACLALGPVYREAWPVTACLALSVLLLLALDLVPIRRDERTALADLVLLTPLIFLAVERLL